MLSITVFAKTTDRDPVVIHEGREFGLGQAQTHAHAAIQAFAQAESGSAQWEEFQIHLVRVKL